MKSSLNSDVKLCDGPIIQLDIDSVSFNLTDVQGLIKIVQCKLRHVNEGLARKIGVAIIYLITYEQIQIGIEPDYRNINRELDQYYFSLSDRKFALNLQRGIDESIDVVRKLSANGRLNRLKEELIKLTRKDSI